MKRSFRQVKKMGFEKHGKILLQYCPLCFFLRQFIVKNMLVLLFPISSIISNQFYVILFFVFET